MNFTASQRILRPPKVMVKEESPKEAPLPQWAGHLTLEEGTVERAKRAIPIDELKNTIGKWYSMPFPT